MKLLTFFLASGLSFFGGAALIILAIGIIPFWKSRTAPLIARLMILAGLILMLFSATPIHPAYYILFILLVLVILIIPHLRASALQKTRFAVLARSALAAFCLIGVLAEVPYLFNPRGSTLKYSDIYVVGDSISAGLEDGEVTWPRILEERHGMHLVNLSEAGQTLHTALPKLANIPKKPVLILLEIGGNDMLSPVPVEIFTSDLETLLTHVVKPGREVIMMELPLPPFFNNYGRAQRSLAKRFGVKMIPKRKFARILTGPGYNMDGLHLSPRGAEAMASMIWDQLGDHISP